MKVGQQYYDKAFGYGIISEINESGFKVRFYSRTVIYPHTKNERIISVIIWGVIVLVSVLGLGYFVL
jgi:hypothetical protein